MQRRSHTLWVFCALQMILVACRHKPPAPIAVAQRLVRPWYVCWGTRPPNPPQSRVVVNLPLDRTNGRERVPSAADSAAVASFRGRLLHTFHVPVFRVEIDTVALPSLMSQLRVGGAFAIRDTSRLDVEVQLYYDGSARPDDLARLQALGPTYAQVSPMKSMVYASVPDSIIPLIRTLPYLVGVQAQSAGCAVIGEEWKGRLRGPS